jgi:Mn2+/Fe2+ NRAMP family transporter
LATAVVGNVIEAAADLGGMAAALNVIVPIPISGMVVILGVSVLSVQLWNYTLLRSVFRWLALALLAYLGSAFLAKPELLPVLKGRFIPTIHFNKEFFAMLVAVIGTTLSAYLYSWQSNQDVEEDISMRSPTLDRPHRHNGGGAAPLPARCRFWNALLESGDVLHHPFDRRDPIQGWQDRHQ